MYKKDDLQINGSRILVKVYTGSETNGVMHFNWETLLEINQSKCIYALHSTMEKLLNTFL